MKPGPKSVIVNAIDTAIQAISIAKKNPQWKNNRDFDKAIQKLIKLKKSM